MRRCDPHDCDCARRRMLRALAGSAALLSGGAAARDAGDDAPRAGDRLIEEGSSTLLTAADLRPGARQRFAWAYDLATQQARNATRRQRILLIRLERDEMDAPTRARSADGVLAYSALCTHGECEVSEWRPQRKALHCPCHFSHFLPLQGAAVASGPARDPLPALPLRTDAQGRLELAGGFDAPAGGR